MNDLAREKLVQAGLQGVKQIKKAFQTQDGGLCALGVLGWKYGITGFEDAVLRDYYEMSSAGQRCPMCRIMLFNEKDLIIHFNDDHDLDFLTIARKL